MYFYYQLKGGEEQWHEALASQRESIIASKAPRYATILNLSTLINDETTSEEIQAIRYFGDLYFDFDSDDIEMCISQVQKFIKKLNEIELNLSEVNFYATGKKGFHVTIPQECFNAKPNAKGTQGLPHIYKEMAFSLYVDTMDLVVYSAKKGRMFRTVNVERENGRYKVQVSAQEMADMTEDMYIELTAAPRKLIAATTPTLNEKLAVMYAKAEHKVAAAAKRRGAASKDVEALAKFKGEFPDTIRKMMDGENIADGAGFNKIAMQLGIAANGLGKSEADFLTACDGLIKNHASDGTRYNSERKRETELRRMFEYTQGNVCYSYSVGAIKSLLKPGEAAADLDGMTGAEGEILSGSDADTEESLYGGVFVTSKGIYRKTEEGVVQICDLAFNDIKLLVDMSDNSVSGYETDVLFKGAVKGRRHLGLEAFTSKGKFQPFVMTNSGIFTGSDSHVTSAAGRLRDIALKENNTVYLVNKEGLDIISRKTENGPVNDLIWVGAEKVSGDSELSYRFKSKLTVHGMYNTDLMDAPRFTGDEVTAKVVEALLNLNEPYVVANLLGWYTACFHRQLYNKIYHQFPIAQVFGQAGSGKSSTVHALLHMFYYLVDPKMISATGNTKFTIDSYMQCSASIPCALDEYKPREMSPAKRGELRTLFREAYNANAFGKGGGGDGLNSNWREVQMYSYSAPLIFIGEAMETETAVVERSVAISLRKSGLAGRDKNIQIVRDNRHVLSSIGRHIVNTTFDLSLDGFKESFNSISDELRASSFINQNDRVLFNIAVVLNGLSYFQKIITMEFGDRFDEKFTQLFAAVKDLSSHTGLVVMSEAAKVMNRIAYITRSEHQESEFGMRKGEDYFFDDKYVDLKIRNAYIKYSTWCHRKGETALYDNEDAFAQGLSSFVACVDRVVPNSPLKDSNLTKVFRFDKQKLEAEEVEDFR